MNLFPPFQNRRILWLMLAWACAIPQLHAAWEWTSPEPVWWTETTKPPGYNASYTGYGYVHVTQGNGRIVGIKRSSGTDYSLLTSQDGTQWDLLPQPSSILSYLTFANGEFLLKGSADTLLTSSDGQLWTTLNTNLASLVGIAYGNGLYASIAYDGTLWTSTDKTQWVQRTTTVPNTYSDGAITYANGLFVALTTTYTSGNAVVLTSSDGLTWNSQALTGGFYEAAFVKYLNGQFIIGGIGGKIFTSQDGLTWTSHAIPAGGWGMLDAYDWVLSAAHGNGIYVAVGFKGLVLTSTDGNSWSFQDRPVISDLYSVLFFNGQFLAFGKSGTVISSTDGIHWQSLGSEPQANQRPSIRYDGGQFIAVGGRGSILTSTDGLAWTTRRQPDDTLYSGSASKSALFDSASGPGRTVAVGYGGVILSSPDLATWSQQTSGSTASLYGATYAAGQFIAVGDSGTILSSTDGLTWTSRASGFSQSLKAVTRGANLFVTVGTGGLIRTSSDGITWTTQVSGTTQELRAITFAAGHFIAVGANRTILASTDGFLWTTKASGGIGGYYGLAYGDGQFIATDFSGTLTVSIDGTTWTSRSSGASELIGIAFGGNAFVASGGDNGYLYRGVLLSLSSPSSKTVVGGQPVTLTVTPSGTGPFTYQWKKDGSPISGANSASYPIAAFSAGDIGSYTVQVDSPVNTVTSTPAWLDLFVDNDGDGVSNTWENANGFDPETGGDIQTLDTDQDGVKDILEIFQGTNRSSSSSAYGLQNTSAVVDAVTKQLKTRYRRSTSQTAVARTLEWSDDLVLGFTANTNRGDTTVSFSESVIDSGPGYEIVEVTTTVVLGTPTKLFFNLGLQPVE